MSDEPLYELTVHFEHLTDDGVRRLAEWIISSPETVHMTYWMSKQDQEEEEPEEVSGDESNRP